MTGAIVLTVLTVLCAVGVLAAVLAGQRPDEGWLSWVRSAFGDLRGDELTADDGDRDDDELEVGGLGTLYLMSEPGSAYTRPEDLGSLAWLRETRRPVPGLQIELAPPAEPTRAQV